jgi:pilus assembly protein Flp/PilA
MKSVQQSTEANGIKKLARDERGATLVEYLMLAGLVAMAAFAGFSAFGSSVENVIKGQAATVGTIATTPQ